ncbi:hypothetical protein DPMN_168860 [Dreissena polymorpha]|uniref:Uncharacterized protein n=1 Tax=Dreissena polymorpha TaxID=45954 RepID=A0A9D4IXM5_DREPO|nr:hypothetical protein DPMN_168860 [Dreissena polymorpha]
MPSPLLPIRPWKTVRTNHDVEGWHNRLSRQAKKGNLSFYLLITLLFEEATEVPRQCKLSRTIQGRLWAAWDCYGKKEICTSELLNECYRLYEPVWAIEWNWQEVPVFGGDNPGSYWLLPHSL